MDQMLVDQAVQVISTVWQEVSLAVVGEAVATKLFAFAKLTHTRRLIRTSHVRTKTLKIIRVKPKPAGTYHAVSKVVGKDKK